MKLPAILRFPILLAALIVVVAAGAAGAATIRVGVNGGASVEPELIDPCVPSCTLDVYVDLEDALVDPEDRVASVFQADFDILMTAGSWNVTLDLSEVDPGVSPFGVGTWNAVGNLTSTRVSVSLISDNLGGERLVFQLHLESNEPADPDLFELFLGSDPKRIIVERDVTGGVDPVDLTSPDLGSRVFATPEPSTGLLLAAGLMGLVAAVRQARV